MVIHERQAIVQWLEQDSRCPLSRRPLSVRKDIQPHYALRRKIQQWQQDHGISEPPSQNSTDSDDDDNSRDRCIARHDHRAAYIAHLRAGCRIGSDANSESKIIAPEPDVELLRIQWSARNLYAMKRLENIFDDYDRMMNQSIKDEIDFLYHSSGV
jgi:U-box domain